MLKGESLLDYINLLSPNDYENNNKKYKKMKNEKKKMKKTYCVICGKYRKFEKRKIS